MVESEPMRIAVEHLKNGSVGVLCNQGESPETRQHLSSPTSPDTDIFVTTLVLVLFARVAPPVGVPDSRLL